METDFGGGGVRDDAALNKRLSSQTALGRVGLPDDIGAAVALLLAPGNHWITDSASRLRWGDDDLSEEGA